MSLLMLAFVLPLVTPAVGGEVCTISKSGDALEFRCGERLVGRYLFAPTQWKPHFHPLYARTGEPLTRFFPMVKDVPGETKDHPHHRGCWVGHQIVILDAKREGEKPINANFWAELVDPRKQVQGQQVCVKVEQPASEPGHAWVVTHNDWRTVSGRKMLEEKRTLHLYDLKSAWLIVLDLDFHASEGEITFGDEKDGFFAIRVADVMAEKSKKGGLLENAEGKQHMGVQDNRERQGCWGLRSAWVDYSGPAPSTNAEKGNKTVGVALLDHPQNSVPACWHARDYGLLSANPFGRKGSKFPDAVSVPDLVKVPAGQRLRFRYGLLIHDGDAKQGRVAEGHRHFSSIP